MKWYLVHVMIFITAVVIAVQPAAAITETTIPFYTTDCAMFIQPTSFTDLVITQFHQVNTSCVSLGTLDIDFPPMADKIVLGPVAGAVTAGGLDPGAGSTANVIPFGPVNLALPSIRQTTDNIASCQRTYFFSDVGG